MPRQVYQSLFQFLTVFLASVFTALLQYPNPPSSWGELYKVLWFPVIGGLAGAFSIYGASKIPAGNKPPEGE